MGYEEVIANMSADDVAALQSGQYVDERAANEIAARQTGMQVREEQQAIRDAEIAAALQTPEGQQEMQQTADTVENIAMQGTQVPPGFQPVVRPKFADTLNLSPQPPETIGLPSTLKKPVGSDIEQEAIMARKAMAQQAAQQMVANEAAEQTAKDVAEAEQKDAGIENQVKQDMSGDEGWGRKIAQAVAVMIGAASQAYTGAKDNPAVIAMEKEIERQAAARKYNDEQKEKLYKQALELADLELKKRQANVNNQESLAKIDLTRAQIGEIHTKIQAAQEVKNMNSRKVWSQEDIDALPETVEGDRIRGKMIRMADGTYRKALNAEVAQKLTGDILPQLDNALNSAKKVRELNKYFGNNILKKLVARGKVGESENAVQELVGSMRLEYFGPGVLTDFEQEIARSIVGKPDAIFSLSSANLAKANSVIDKLKFARRVRLREAGVDLPASQNELKLQKLKEKYPTANQAELISALIEAGKWDANED